MTDIIEHKLDRLHDKVDALRNAVAADRVLLAERLTKVEAEQQHMAGKIKTYLLIIGGVFTLGANMFWDWAKVKLGLGH